MDSTYRLLNALSTLGSRVESSMSPGREAQQGGASQAGQNRANAAQLCVSDSRSQEVKLLR